MGLGATGYTANRWSNSGLSAVHIRAHSLVSRAARHSSARVCAVLVSATLELTAVAVPSDRNRAIDPKRSTVPVHVFKSGLFRAFADDHVIEAPLPEGSLARRPTAGDNELDIEAGDRSPEIGRQHGGVDACGAVTAIDGRMDPGESAWANLAITSVW